MSMNLGDQIQDRQKDNLLSEKEIINGLNTLLAQRDNEIELFCWEIEDMNKTIANLKKTIGAKEMSICQVCDTLSERDKEIKLLKMQFDDLPRNMTFQRDQLAKAIDDLFKPQIRDLEILLGKRDGEIKSLKDQLAKYEEEEFIDSLFCEEDNLQANDKNILMISKQAEVIRDLFDTNLKLEVECKLAKEASEKNFYLLQEERSKIEGQSKVIEQLKEIIEGQDVMLSNAGKVMSEKDEKINNLKSLSDCQLKSQIDKMQKYMDENFKIVERKLKILGGFSEKG